MTEYLNAHTRNGGTKHVIVPKRIHGGELGEAPVDGTQYVRVNGEWAPGDFGIEEAPVDGAQYAREDGAWVEAPRVHIQTGVTGTTDADGYVTVSHGAPFTPRVIQHQHTTLAASLGYNIGADQITATTVRLRFGKWDATTILVSDSIGTGALICWK